MSVGIQVEARGFVKAQSALRRLADADLHDLLDNIGSEIEEQTHNRSRNEKTSPEGDAWAKLSPKYERWKAKRTSGVGKGGGLLMLTGDMDDSIQYFVTGDELEIGTNLIYGATHQYGDKDRNIPARPFLGLSHENQDDIEDLVTNFFEELIT